MPISAIDPEGLCIPPQVWYDWSGNGYGVMKLPTRPLWCKGLESLIESYLNTSEEKMMWRYYTAGSGKKLNLSKNMENIMESAKFNIDNMLQPCSSDMSWSVSGSKPVYTNSPWELGLGNANLNYTASCEDGCLSWSVSLVDTYDFDRKTVGERTKENESRTRWVHLVEAVASCGWKPYSVTGTISGQSGTCCQSDE
jgi:hypothetical protein